jgi:hypothetical protein
MALALPYKIVALLTFPGVVVHEVVEQLFCRWRRVAILNVCYFRFDNPAGFVIHEPDIEVHQMLWISLGPLVVNSLLGALIAFPAILPALEFRVATVQSYVLAWLGLSIAMHAFPDSDDARNLWRALRSHQVSTLTRVFVMPIAAAMYVGAVGRLLWLDLFYGIGVISLIPALWLYNLP